jgi:hypothetical protein
MDLGLLDGLRDPDATWANRNVAGQTAPPEAGSAAAEPTSSGLSEVGADPGMAPYGDVGQARRPANGTAQGVLISVADLRDSASTGADIPVGSDASSAEPELQGPVTSPGQLSASPADAAAEAHEPLTEAGDIQPAAPQQPASNAPVSAAPGTPRALAEAADDAVFNAKVDAEHGLGDNRSGSLEQRKAAGQLNQIKAAIAAVAAWEVAGDKALESAERAHPSDRVSAYDDPEVKACDAGLAAAKARRNQVLVGTPLARAEAADHAVDDARHEVEQARKAVEDELDAGPYHSVLKLKELQQRLADSRVNYRNVAIADVAECKAALEEAIGAAKRAHVSVEDDPQVRECRFWVEVAEIDKDYFLNNDRYYTNRLKGLLQGT